MYTTVRRTDNIIFVLLNSSATLREHDDSLPHARVSTAHCEASKQLAAEVLQTKSLSLSSLALFSLPLPSSSRSFVRSPPPRLPPNLLRDVAVERSLRSVPRRTLRFKRRDVISDVHSRLLHRNQAPRESPRQALLRVRDVPQAIVRRQQRGVVRCTIHGKEVDEAAADNEASRGELEQIAHHFRRGIGLRLRDVRPNEFHRHGMDDGLLRAALACACADTVRWVCKMGGGREDGERRRAKREQRRRGVGAALRTAAARGGPTYRVNMNIATIFYSRILSLFHFFYFIFSPQKLKLNNDSIFASVF